MPPPPKGKAPTKGAKQILVENTATVYFYRNMSLVSAGFYGVVILSVYSETPPYGIIFMNILTLLIYLGCHQAMKYISRPSYSANNQLLDPGLDLNMEGGMGEHIKDIIILTSITHVLATATDYFWLLLLLLPIRAVWLIWSNFLGPWFFQESPQEKEQDEKKKKKFERKMKRFQQ